MMGDVWGTINGASVTWTPKNADRTLWQATYAGPAATYYIVAVWAQDLAGNQAYTATIWTPTEDTPLLCIQARIGSGKAIDISINSGFSFSFGNGDDCKCQ
jgi:hypothetical protein